LEASDGTVAGWVGDHLALATQDVRTTVEASTEADLLARTSAASLAAGRQTAERQAAHAAATARVAEHDETALGDLRERLRRAERAGPLSELEGAVAEDVALVARLRREAASVTASWLRIAAADQAPQSDSDLPEVLAAARRALDVVDAAQPDAERLHEVARLCHDVADELAGATVRATELATELEASPTRLREAEAALAAAESAEQRLPALRTTLATARECAGATVELIEVASSLEVARRDRDAARARVASLRETWLDLREARLNGMAAEIAGSLAVGAGCPVCGSHDHPHPAVASVGSPDATSERAARRDVDDAEAVLVVLDDQLRQSEGQHTRLLTLAAGRTADDAALALAESERAHDETAALAMAVADVRGEVMRRRTADDELRKARDLAVQRRTDLDSRLELQRAEHQRLRERIDEVLDGTGCPSVAALRELRSRQLEALARACAAHEQLTLAERDLARAERALADAASGAGFESVADARRARLEEGERDELAAELTRVDEALGAARAVLDDPDHQVAAALPRPDVAALATNHADAEVRARVAHARHDEAERRHHRLTILAEQVTAALAAWSPVREELELTARLALFVEGRSPDNALQMRLSAYVLAHRLTQVVAAANERLARMSDQRYSLEHTGKRGAGETRGGLSLLVRDDWSGEARDPATLSGGETFVVSLALALGLADVITQEAGGADLDTLFVDEGFGSLDADTLDDVMDTLDGLRDGGRVVGVVSHVAEMQTRIPSQLRVTKGRDGSRLSVTAG
jgi:exonuclease SbcC